MYETVILGGGPAGTGSLVWAARHGLLKSWLDSGVAVVEQRDWLGGSLGRFPLNADSVGASFLECLDGPACELLLTELSADPVTQELERWRTALPPLELVDRFTRRLGALLLKEVARHPRSHVFTSAAALALHLKADGSVAVPVIRKDGRRNTIHAASAVVALGGRPNTFWATVELAPGLFLAHWRNKIVSSHALLSHGGGVEVRRRLARVERPSRVVILGSAHSAFSAAWVLLERIPNLRFEAKGMQVLYRSEPRVMYPSRAAAKAESYTFNEGDVCQATGRVHRLGGLRGDGRDLWRRMRGLTGKERDRRAVARPLGDLTRAELIGLLDDADLIVPALGYRLQTVPVFDAHGEPVMLAHTGPAVGPDSQLLTSSGTAVPNVFGIGLGSGFRPWGAMAGEASFRGQQNSQWLYQHGLGEMIYHGTRLCAARRRAYEISTPVPPVSRTRNDHYSEILNAAPSFGVEPVEAGVRGA